jgi:hypothetical protein
MLLVAAGVLAAVAAQTIKLAVLVHKVIMAAQAVQMFLFIVLAVVVVQAQ